MEAWSRFWTPRLRPLHRFAPFSRLIGRTDGQRIGSGDMTTDRVPKGSGGGGMTNERESWAGGWGRSAGETANLQTKLNPPG